MSNIAYSYCELPTFIRKPIWRALHAIITSKDAAKEIVFMNYGYAYVNSEIPESGPELKERDEEDRYCLQLYDIVGGREEHITGKKVLEVGCGRGGGASYLSRYFSPDEYVGIDISKKVIDFCERVHSDDKLHFRQGEAEDVPVQDSSVDAVINVESSRCYRDRNTFFAEVGRVLKPGGTLLFADMRQPHEMSELEEQFDSNGLSIEEKEDITAGVIRALEKDHSRRVAMMKRLTPFYLRRAVPDFVGVKDSKRYNSFADGSMLYVRYVLRKS
jgi:ubiquinone/menaquinone biosynthesis C-methylase UbiE